MCGKEVLLPFTGRFCHLTYCGDHRLPERHNCQKLPKREWRLESSTTTVKITTVSTGPAVAVTPKDFFSKCPKCDSKNLSILSDTKFDNYECNDCGYKWKFPDEDKKFLSQGKGHFVRNPYYKKKSFWSMFRR